MSPTTAGYSVTVKGGRLYLVDQAPNRGDCRISPHEARELAQRLIHAAAAAERDRQPGGNLDRGGLRTPPGGPDTPPGGLPRRREP